MARAEAMGMSDLAPQPGPAPAPAGTNVLAAAKPPVAPRITVTVNAPVLTKTQGAAKPPVAAKPPATVQRPAQAASPQPAQALVTAPQPPRREARAAVFAALDRLIAKAETMGKSDPLPTPPPAPVPTVAKEPPVAQAPIAPASLAPAAVATAGPAPASRAAALTIAAALKTPADDNRLFEVRTMVSGQALFACRAIGSGTRLFGEDDWVDETEKRSFTTLTEAQLVDLAPAMRAAFLRFAYNVTPEQIRGTFRPEGVRHPVNFINHSCEPNAGYDGADHIVALRRIAAGEEIQMDYGTYSFSFDHDFTCTCGAWACRGKVTREDWPELVRSGLRLPAFMRAQANKALWG